MPIPDPTDQVDGGDPTGPANQPATVDFARPGLLTRQRARLLQHALDDIAREATDALRFWLPDVRVEPGEVEQRTLADLAGGDVHLVGIELPQRVDRGLVILELPLAASLVLFLLGSPAATTGDRPLTPLETDVLDLVLNPLLDCVGPVLSLGAVEIGVHTSDLEQVSFVDDRELVVGVPFELTSDRSTGRLWIVLTSSALQPFTVEQEERRARQAHAGPEADRRRNEALVQRVTVPVVCGFPAVRVPAHELGTLQPGDVLRTGHATSRDLVLSVGGSAVFAARVGQRGQRLVGEVIGVLDPTNHTTPTPRGGAS